MSRAHKDVERSNAKLSRVEREQAVDSIALMFPADFRWVAAALMECLELERLEEGWCMDCDGRARVRYPDYKARLKTLELVIAHKVGKPTERKTVDINARVVQERAELEGLSDAELLEIAEGEWDAVPPAA